MWLHDGHVSNFVEERPAGNQRIPNDRHRVERLSQPPAPEKRRDLRSRDFDHVDTLHAAPQGRQQPCPRTAPGKCPGTHFGLTGCPRLTQLLTTFHRFCTGLVAGGGPGRPPEDNQPDGQSPLSLPPPGQMQDMCLPLQGSVDAPDITHAWVFTQDREIRNDAAARRWRGRVT